MCQLPYVAGNRNTNLSVHDTYPLTAVRLTLNGTETYPSIEHYFQPSTRSSDQTQMSTINTTNYEHSQETNHDDCYLVITSLSGNFQQKNNSLTLTNFYAVKTAL